MMDKFKNCDFGRCPRVFCNGQACLPVGLSGVCMRILHRGCTMHAGDPRLREVKTQPCLLTICHTLAAPSPLSLC